MTLSHTLDKLTDAAALLVEQGITDRAAFVLAYVLRFAPADSDLYAIADELFDELEASICPRVILDAREWAASASLPDAMHQLKLAVSDADGL